MSNLRHDLMTSGWSMMDCSKWINPLRFEWGSYKLKANHRDYYGCEYPPVLKQYSDEMSWLLHEALPEEFFYLTSIQSRMHANDHSDYQWHRDRWYLRVLFTCSGDGTIAAKSFENNLMTPAGYALILTGNLRNNKTGIPSTWHTSPKKPKWDDPQRLLLILNYSG